MSKLMSETISSDSPSPSVAKVDPYKAIANARQKASSKVSFFQDVLRTIVKEFSSPYGLIYVDYGSEVIEYDWHTGTDDPHLWKPFVHQFLTHSFEKKDASARILNSKDGTKKLALLSSPIVDIKGATIGAVALILFPSDNTQIIKRLTLLKGLTYFASYIATSNVSVSTENSQDRTKSEDYRGVSKAAKFSSVDELAFAITNNLRMQFDCEQVAISLVEGANVRLLSISGQDNVIKRHPGIVPLLASMEECLDAGEIIICQRNHDYNDSADRIFYLHKQWHSFAKGDAVASIPLEFEGKIVAILSLRRAADRPFTLEELEDIKAKVGQFVPAMILLVKANRGLLRHIGDEIKNIMEWAKQPGRYKSKAAVAASVIFSLWFLFGSMNYSVSVPCNVEPAIVRQISVPTEAVLANVFHIAGDRVKKGEILCEFEHRELDDNLEKIKAELAVIEHQMDGYLAKGDSINVRLLQAKKALALAKLQIVKNRIARAIVRAPINGVIISGDLRKRIGAMMNKGEKLFEVASSEKLLIKAKVPESEIDEMQANLPGEFVPYACPDDVLDIRTSRVYPRAEVLDGKNVYVVEADVMGIDDKIKPGMEGTVNIIVGKKRPWWIVFHRLIDYLRYKFLL